MAKNSGFGGNKNLSGSEGGRPSAPGGNAKSGSGSASGAGGKGTLGPMGGTVSGGKKGMPADGERGFNKTNDGGSGMPN